MTWLRALLLLTAAPSTSLNAPVASSGEQWPLVRELPSTTPSKPFPRAASLLLQRASDGACLSPRHGMMVAFGPCGPEAAWQLRGDADRGWDILASSPGSHHRSGHHAASRQCLQRQAMMITDDGRGLALGPCEGSGGFGLGLAEAADAYFQRQRWVLRESSGGGATWTLVWREHFRTRQLCVGSSVAGTAAGTASGTAGATAVADWRKAELTAQEGGCAAFQVLEWRGASDAAPAHFASAPAVAALLDLSWWLAAITSLMGNGAAATAEEVSSPLTPSWSSSSFSRSQEAAAVAAALASGPRATPSKGQESPGWVGAAASLEAAELGFRSSTATTSRGHVGGSGAGDDGGVWWAAESAAATGRNRRTAATVADSPAPHAAPHAPPALMTRQGSRPAHASGYAHGSASGSGSGSNGGSGSGNSGGISSGGRSGGGVWTEPGTGLAFDLALGPEFNDAIVSAGASGAAGAAGAAGFSLGSQELLGGGAFSKWGLAVYAVAVYAEAAPAFGAAVLHARAQGIAQNMPAHGITAAAEAATDATASAGNASSSIDAAARAVAEKLLDLSPAALAADEYFFLALASPAAFDRTVVIKLAMAVRSDALELSLHSSRDSRVEEEVGGGCTSRGEGGHLAYDARASYSYDTPASVCCCGLSALKQVNPSHLQSAMMAAWQMPPQHKRRLLSATDRALLTPSKPSDGSGGGDGSGGDDGGGSSNGKGKCCRRGTEMAFTWRGRTGSVELRLNGRLVDVMVDQAAAAEAQALQWAQVPPPSSSSGGVTAAGGEGLVPGAAVATPGLTPGFSQWAGAAVPLSFSSSSSSSSASSASLAARHLPSLATQGASFAPPPPSMAALGVEMASALTDRPVSAPTIAAGGPPADSAFPHAPFGTSLPRALLYQ